MKAEDGGLWPRAREPPEPPEPPEVGEARREPSLESSDGVWPGDTLISDGPQNWEGIHFCPYKASKFAVGNKNRKLLFL